MSPSYVIDVPQPQWVNGRSHLPDTLRVALGPGRWEVTHTSEDEGRDALILIARRVKEDPNAS